MAKEPADPAQDAVPPGGTGLPPPMGGPSRGKEQGCQGVQNAALKGTGGAPGREERATAFRQQEADRSPAGEWSGGVRGMVLAQWSQE